MKIILKKDVPKLGNEGEIKEVSDGYARNYLIPKGLAVEATKSEMSKLNAKKEHREMKEERIREKSEELLKKVSSRHFTIKVKAGSSGKLFGSVTSADIADKIEKDTGTKIDKKYINLPENIRETGDHEVELELPGNVKGVINLTVEGIEGD
ncbi:MAG: 50S ribosomal protein L9 [Kosmotogaceae bacterium]